MSTTSIELTSIAPPAPVELPLRNPSADSRIPITRESIDISSSGRSIREHEEQGPRLSKRMTAAVISSVTCITTIGSLLAGLVTVMLPTIAKDLDLAPSLVLWPSSIYALTCGCTLLLSGSVADVVGARPMYLTGCLLQTVFTLATGLASSGEQLLLFRALAGVATSFCLPSSVSILSDAFPEGSRLRSIAFATMGGGQPLGFIMGLVLGGLFADSVGWRWGFHTTTIVNAVIFIVAMFGLPASSAEDAERPFAWKNLVTDVDWVGTLLASVSLCATSYVFATVTGSVSSIRSPLSLSLLGTSAVLIIFFVLWVGRQERLGRPALVPNSLWRSRVFTSICISIFLAWGSFNAVETVAAFYMQSVQGSSALQSSLHFLPSAVGGAATNLAIGLVVHRVRADAAIGLAALLSALAPLLLALIDPAWIFWRGLFVPMLLNPVIADVLFTVSNLVITATFAAERGGSDRARRRHGLAGGVFNTLAQIGKSVGLATSAIVASAASGNVGFVVHGEEKSDSDALLAGYRAAFWYCFGLTLATIVVCFWGLRKIGKVGVKRD